MIRGEDTNMCSRIVDMKRSLSGWRTIYISLYLVVILSRAEGLSKCHSLYVSPQNINLVILQFLWKSKTHYVKRSQLLKDVRAFDFESIVGTFTIT